MVPIWPEAEDHYLYVEQAVSFALDRPYRQRVYKLTEPEPGVFHSTVYDFHNPLRFAEDWKKDNPLDSLPIDSLRLRTGCVVILKMEGDKYVGATNEQDCTSDFNGAAYATAEIEITQDKVLSWDRGWDAEGNYVWGAEKGAYVFDKVEDF